MYPGITDRKGEVGRTAEYSAHGSSFTVLRLSFVVMFDHEPALRNERAEEWAVCSQYNGTWYKNVTLRRASQFVRQQGSTMNPATQVSRLP